MGLTTSSLKEGTENFCRPPVASSSSQEVRYINGLTPRHPFPGVRYEAHRPMKSANTTAKIKDIESSIKPTTHSKETAQSK